MKPLLSEISTLNDMDVIQKISCPVAHSNMLFVDKPIWRCSQHLILVYNILLYQQDHSLLTSTIIIVY